MSRGLCCLQVFGVDFSWWSVPDCRVESFVIVPKFDISLNVCLCFLAGTVRRSVDEFVFECSEEGFGHRVIETDSGRARTSRREASAGRTQGPAGREGIDL